ncbi:Histone acetyltransferase type B subunit 2 [Savitreella phatthalungensis]
MSVDGIAEDEQERIQEQQRINEEYKLWKKNAAYLYDTVIAHALDWPTLTCQWFPDVESDPAKDYETHRLLLGTHTSDADQNYLQVAHVQIPKLQRASPSNTDTNKGKYDEERGEAGGYGAGQGAKFQVVQKIDHEGEVNKARYRPQNPNVIATLAPSGDVLVFDRTMHSLTPTGICKPQLRLKGHKNEGWGLSWHPGKRDGLLLTAADDVRLWDVEKAGPLKNDGSTVVVEECEAIFRSHKSTVNDVAWHPTQENWFGSVSDDCHLNVHDIRSDSRDKPQHAIHAHQEPINSLCFSPHNDTIVVVGSSDHTLSLWDLRMTKKCLHTLEGHEGDVQSIRWHPSEAAIFASAATDRKVILWDLSRIGEEQSDEDLADGPPELFFLHAGHTDLVHDLDWNPNRPWTLVSAAQDNIVQVWQPASNLTGHDDLDDDDDDEEEDEDDDDDADIDQDEKASSSDAKMSDK